MIVWQVWSVWHSRSFQKRSRTWNFTNDFFFIILHLESCFFCRTKDWFDSWIDNIALSKKNSSARQSCESIVQVVCGGRRSGPNIPFASSSEGLRENRDFSNNCLFYWHILYWNPGYFTASVCTVSSCVGGGRAGSTLKIYSKFAIPPAGVCNCNCTVL